MANSGGFKGGGGEGGRPPPILAQIFFLQKAASFRVKGTYFVVRICDK